MGTQKSKRPAEVPSGQPSAPGRVVFDSRGNPVWEWNTDAGDSTSVLLKQLENDDLALEPTRSFRSPHCAPAKSGRSNAERPRRTNADERQPFGLENEGPGKGFDPYNRS